MPPLHTSNDLVFKKSSYSSSHGQNCVEVADLPQASAVRDSKRREAGHLMFAVADWHAFLEGIKHDRL